MKMSKTIKLVQWVVWGDYHEMSHNMPLSPCLSTGNAFKHCDN